MLWKWDHPRSFSYSHAVIKPTERIHDRSTVVNVRDFLSCWGFGLIESQYEKHYCDGRARAAVRPSSQFKLREGPGECNVKLPREVPLAILRGGSTASLILAVIGS